MNDDVTKILDAAAAGDADAADQLLPLVYDELRRLASSKMAQESGPSILATELVHEAYLRLVGTNDQTKWDGRGHYFGAAAEAMRRILIDRARARKAKKRGGDLAKIQVNTMEYPVLDQPDRLLELDEALQQFEQLHEAKAKVVKLRFFAGMTIREAAAALGISEATADRHWAFARAWLKVAMDS